MLTRGVGGVPSASIAKDSTRWKGKETAEIIHLIAQDDKYQKEAGPHKAEEIIQKTEPLPGVGR